MGLTRSEQWTLIVVVVLIAGGFAVQSFQARREDSVVWVQAGDRWKSLPKTEPAEHSSKAQLSDSSSPTLGSSAGSDVLEAIESDDPATESRPQGGMDTPGGRLAVDLNSAAPAKLELLPGIGPVKAGAIVAYRSEYGAFRAIEELLKVKGIGPKTLEAVRPLVRIGPLEVSSVPSRTPQAPGEASTAYTPDKKDFSDIPLDVNRASSQELQSLKGIGPVLAERIIRSRQNRPFRSVEELRRVHGIGPKTLAQIRERVIVR